VSRARVRGVAVSGADAQAACRSQLRQSRGVRGDVQPGSDGPPPARRLRIGAVQYVKELPIDGCEGAPFRLQSVLRSNDDRERFAFARDGTFESRLQWAVKTRHDTYRSRAQIPAARGWTGLDERDGAAFGTERNGIERYAERALQGRNVACRRLR